MYSRAHQIQTCAVSTSATVGHGTPPRSGDTRWGHPGAMVLACKSPRQQPPKSKWKPWVHARFLTFMMVFNARSRLHVPTSFCRVNMKWHKWIFSWALLWTCWKATRGAFEAWHTRFCRQSEVSALVNRCIHERARTTHVMLVSCACASITLRGRGARLLVCNLQEKLKYYNWGPSQC